MVKRRKRKEEKRMICPENPKCSNTAHKDVDASVFCPSCGKYFCPTCDKALHETIFIDHHPVPLKETTPNTHLITGRCNAPGHHNNPLEYYCKDHNTPCCGMCLCVKDDVGKHSKCQTVPLKSMEHHMQSTLAAAIKDLEDTIGKAEETLRKVRETQEKNDKAKNDVVKQIKENFEAIRKAVDARENELLSLVEELWEKESSCEKMITTGTDKPEEGKQIAVCAKKIGEHWDTERLPEMAQHYGLVVDTTKELRQFILDADDICKKDLEIKYSCGVEGIDGFIGGVMKFGDVFVKPEFNVCMKESPNSRYVLEGPSNTIIKKTCSNGWNCTAIGNDPLPQNTITEWDVKIISTTQNGHIMVGVAPQDIDVNAGNNFSKCGWYFFCYNSTLYSGPPKKHSGDSYGQGKNLKAGDIVGVKMDTTKGELSFSVNGVSLGVAYDGIPLDKPLVPAIDLYNTNDSVEIILG